MSREISQIQAAVGVKQTGEWDKNTNARVLSLRPVYSPQNIFQIRAIGGASEFNYEITIKKIQIALGIIPTGKWDDPLEKKIENIQGEYFNSLTPVL